MAVFACAEWKPITGNTGGRLGPNLGLLLHHAVADGSLWDTFQYGDVSAHFWVARDGRIEQYVDSDTVAWHSGSGAGNAQYCGVETEGCAAPPHAEPMTDAMVDGLARLYAEGHTRHGWPNALCDSPGQPGFGYHRLFSATACPCDIRLNRRGDILALAFGTPDVEPTHPSEGNMVLYDPVTHGYWVAKEDGSVLACEGADYLGGSNGAAFGTAGKPCVGIAYWGDWAGGQPGYTTCHRWGPDDYRFFRFPRDGSGQA